MNEVKTSEKSINNKRFLPRLVRNKKTSVWFVCLADDENVSMFANTVVFSLVLAQNIYCFFCNSGGWLVVSLLLAAAFFGCPIITLVFFFLMKMRIGENCSIEEIVFERKKSKLLLHNDHRRSLHPWYSWGKKYFCSVLFWSGRPPHFIKINQYRTRRTRIFFFMPCP